MNRNNILCTVAGLFISVKYLIILGVLAIIFYALLYWRLRPYIATARRIFGIVRDMRRVSMNEPSDNARQANVEGDRLVRCDACGVWIPATRAVKLRSSASSYCSHACLENAAAERSKPKVGGGRQ